MSKSITTKITSEIDDAYDEVVRSLRKMTKHLREDADDAMSQSATKIMESALELVEQTRSKAVEVAKLTGDQVKKHPAAAAAIAAAAVALVGVAIARRDHS